MPLSPHVITGREAPDALSEPLQALVAFYDAFNTADLEKMTRIWAHTDDVVMANPVGGVTIGWDQIQAVYARIFHGLVTVSVEFYDYVLAQSATLFYVTGRERGTFRRDTTTVELAIRTSRIFQHIDGHWLQVHHHGSIDDPDLLARYQAAVHGTQLPGA